MAIVERELQYVKHARFLQNKPSTMYPNPFRLQFFHDAHEGLHGRTNLFLNYYFDTTFVHMAPANPFGTFYYQIDNLLEYHPHVCVGEGYGSVVLYHLMVNKKYDGNSVLLYFPINHLKGSFILPSKGKHCLVFEETQVNEEQATKLIAKVKGTIQKEEDNERIVLKKENVTVYLVKKTREEMNSVELEKEGKFTLKSIVDTVCDKDLAFSRLQDKGNMFINALILCILFFITYGFIGCSMRCKQLEEKKKE